MTICWLGTQLAAAAGEAGIMHRFFPILLCLLATSSLMPRSAEAQPAVLQSGGAQMSPSEVEIRSADGESREVHQVDGRMRGTRHYGLRAIHTSAMASHVLCRTPCRLRLDAPIELAIGRLALGITPDGTFQQLEYTPRNTGLLVLGAFGLGVGILGVVTSGALLAVEFGLPRADLGVDPAILIGAGIGSIGIIVLGIIGMVASRSRFVRVDRIEF